MTALFITPYFLHACRPPRGPPHTARWTPFTTFSRCGTNVFAVGHTLRSSWQAKYCPPLDSSLLAALIADIGPPNPGSDARTPSAEQTTALRAMLDELARQATEQYERELCRELDAAQLSPQCCSTTDGSCSSPDRYGYSYGSRDMSESLTSDSSAHDDQAFSSPLGFLQTAFPHIPPWKLRRALSDTGYADAGDVEMESIVESLLTDEYIRELEERGLDNDEAPDAFDEWQREGTSEKSASPSQGRKPGGKKNARRKTITFGDVRQRQLTPRAPANGPLPGPAPDLWTLVSSVSGHLAHLLPPHTIAFFQPYFHTPNHPSPADAVRAALSDIAGKQSTASVAAPDDPTVLHALLEIVRDSRVYARLDDAQRSNVYADIQLVLRATRGRADDAIDIIWLLLDLELDLRSGNLAMGVYHSLPPAPSTGPTSPLLPSSATSRRPFSRPANAGVVTLPDGPPPSPQPPPTAKRRLSLPTSAPASVPTSPHGNGTGAGEWQIVGRGGKNGKNGEAGIYAHGRGQGHHGYDMRRCVTESWRRQNELLRDATRAWRAGTSKTRGGEVAQCLAERVSHSIVLDTLLRFCVCSIVNRPGRCVRPRNERRSTKRVAWSSINGSVPLSLAVSSVPSALIRRRTYRFRGSDPNTLDLHSTSVSEAIVIVKEILEREGCSSCKSHCPHVARRGHLPEYHIVMVPDIFISLFPAKPLRIITGRGAHSANGVGVLKPAVRNALVRDGWNVSVWNGGLVVRGQT